MSPEALGVADGHRVAVEALLDAWKPRERLRIAEWAERNRVLPRKHASIAGAWRNHRFPYQPGIMDALEWWHPAPVVAVMKSAQSGASDAVLNWIGRGMDTEPASFLALWPSEDTAETWSKSRVSPMIDAIPSLAAVMQDGRHKKGNSVLEKHFRDAILYIGSANKANDVAQVSVPNLVLDDADRMPQTLKDEGDPFWLALNRSKTFPRRKCAVISTPTDEETSRIGRLWKRSTMGRYHVPCPLCGHMQDLIWSGVRWIAGKPQTAVYVCAECEGSIDERKHKTAMLAAGDWRHQFPDRMTDVCGFHITGLLAPLGLGDSWEQHARMYEGAEGSPEAVRVFFNTSLGLPHKGLRKRVSWEDVKKRAEPFPLREPIPRGITVLTSGTDVQADRLETQVLGWGRGKQVATIDTIVHRGDPTRPEVWAELDAYLDSEWKNAFRMPMGLSCSMVDAGYLPDDVLKFTRPRRARMIFACRGSTNPSRTPIGKPAHPDLKGRKAKIDERGAERYELGVSELKHWLFEELRADAGEGENAREPEDRHLHFSYQLDDDYYKQLCAETYDPKEGWIPRANFHRNEMLDTFIYARAAAMHHRVGVDRKTEAGWLRLEEMLEPKDGAAVVQEPAAVVGTTPIKTRSGFFPTAAVTK